MLDQKAKHIGQDICTASIIGDTNKVRCLLQQDPSLVEQKGGPRNWDPLLHLCYGRVISPLNGHNTLETAKFLLSSGADPNTYFSPIPTALSLPLSLELWVKGNADPPTNYLMSIVLN